MSKFPQAAPKARVVAAIEALGLQIIRDREHIAMVRENADGTKTPPTLPNHKMIKSSSHLPSEFDFARRLSQGLRAVVSGDVFCLPAAERDLTGLSTP